MGHLWQGAEARGNNFDHQEPLDRQLVLGPRVPSKRITGCRWRLLPSLKMIRFATKGSRWNMPPFLPLGASPSCWWPPSGRRSSPWPSTSGSTPASGPIAAAKLSAELPASSPHPPARQLSTASCSLSYPGV